MKVKRNANKIIYLFLIISACKAPEGNLSPQKLSFQEEMRQLIQNISKNAKTIKSNFLIIPRNGIELLKNNNEINANYLSAIDGQLVEGQFYGYGSVDQENSKNDLNYFDAFLGRDIIGNKPILNIDFCNSESTINNSIIKNQAYNNKAFISLNKELNLLPVPNIKIIEENNKNIATLADAKNFMALLNFDNYLKENLIEGIAKTNFDVVVIDGFYKNQLFSKNELTALKIKKNGGKRLIICQLDLSNASSKKTYWKQDWKYQLPNFVNKEIGINGDFRVNYWDAEWQKILFGNENSLINTFINLGFDGVILSNADAYKYYE